MTLTALAGVVFCAPLASLVAGSNKPVQIAVKESDRRVDVTIGGQPFTSYIWPTTLKKPVLYPIRTAKGTLVTRGFPLDPRPGERIDHPHHVGLWFNYGDVNGVDFWNNSDAIKPDRKGKMGTIVQKAITVAKGGADRGRARSGCRLGDARRLRHPEGTHEVHLHAARRRRAHDRPRSRRSPPARRAST